MERLQNVVPKHASFQLDLQIQCNAKMILSSYFVLMDKLILEFMGTKKSVMTHVIVRQESNIQSTTAIQAQDELQAHSSEDSTQLKERQVRASRECSKKLT